MACPRVAPALLLHVNIFLVLFSGAGLATGARTKWDPSTYIALRELFPLEYRVLAVALPVAAAALLLLAHFAVVALRTRRYALRRVLLLLYAVLMALMMCAEAALAWWLVARVAAWTRSPAADELQHALQLREHLQPLLEHLAHWHPLPAKLKGLVQEAEKDAPVNLYLAGSAAALLVLLQTAAALLALLLAATRAPRRPRAPRRDCSATSTPLSTTVDSEKTPLRAVYKNGRLVMV